LSVDDLINSFFTAPKQPYHYSRIIRIKDQTLFFFTENFIQITPALPVAFHSSQLQINYIIADH
jgi:hypothetical protein